LNPLVELARQTIEAYVKTGQIIAPPAKLSPEMKGKAGVFVSLKKHGELRGCIGTIASTTGSVAEEVIRNAIEAAARDPRFPPVDRTEIPDLEISVDVLSEPEPISSVKDLDVKRFGVIVKSGHRRGLLLPNLEGVDSPEEQIAISRRKAGIGPDEPVELFRFEVRRYK